MRAERAIVAALGVSILASLGLIVLYALGGGAQLEGILLALALGGVGAAIVIWAIALLPAPIEVEERHSLESTGEERAGAREALDPEQISRRRFLVRLLGGASAVLGAALVLPALSLGPEPGRDLFRTGWRAGSRVVDANGTPIRPGDLPLGSVQTVFPSGEVGRPDSQTLLIRVRAEDLRLAAGRADWAPQGAIGYSKICTHAGCPVGLYRAEEHALLCPCHQSTFDVLRGAVPIFGPAARPLPQLPLEVDGDGYLVARGDFPEPVGPGFWDMTHGED
ncbi:MAG: ubiquinol-cytochrome c reductase iron-sulfur subunit [Chloroflexota bacterium]|nr:ubiquinol-cytochrome c reductase iron-sulfur subunit [Chloroflexota bacterium]